MIKKQFTLYLANKPGALARVTKALAAARVNIEGISVAETTDVGLVQVVVDNAASAKQTLQRHKVPFTEQEVAVLALPNRPGALARATSRLARAGINLNYLYCTVPEATSGEPLVVVSGPNLRRIEKLWRQP